MSIDTDDHGDGRSGDTSVTDAEVDAFIDTESHITGFPGAGEINEDYRERIRFCLTAAKRVAADQPLPEAPSSRIEREQRVQWETRHGGGDPLPAEQSAAGRTSMADHQERRTPDTHDTCATHGLDFAPATLRRDDHYYWWVEDGAVALEGEGYESREAASRDLAAALEMRGQACPRQPPADQTNREDGS